MSSLNAESVRFKRDGAYCLLAFVLEFHSATSMKETLRREGFSNYDDVKEATRILQQAKKLLPQENTFAQRCKTIMEKNNK